jgi:hypothetical protein
MCYFSFPPLLRTFFVDCCFNRPLKGIAPEGVEGVGRFRPVAKQNGDKTATGSMRIDCPKCRLLCRCCPAATSIRNHKHTGREHLGGFHLTDSQTLLHGQLRIK